MTPSRQGRLVLLGILTALCGAFVLDAPAQAAAKPVVSAVPSAPTASAGSMVTIQGTVSRKSKGATIVLQRFRGGTWDEVARGKVSRSKEYHLTVEAKVGANQLRATVLRNQRIRSATSPTVTVNGTGTLVGPPADLEQARALILQQTNAARAQHGVAPLQVDPCVNALAQRWAEHMAASRDYRHNPGPGPGDTCFWSGENIVYGYNPEQVVDVWMASTSGHRENLLEATWTHIGIGYARAADGTPYYTQDFVFFAE
jgi:uncharacterized protein YkwD